MGTEINFDKLDYSTRKNMSMNNISLLEDTHVITNEKSDIQISDANLESYSHVFENHIIEGDIVGLFMRKIDSIININRSLYESSVIESFSSNYNTVNRVDLDKNIPYITPYYTFDEYSMRYPDSDINAYQFILENNQKEYFNKIRELQYEYKRTNNKELLEEVSKLGWNPIVPIDGVSIKKSRERQIKYFEKNIIDITEIANLNDFNTANIDEDIEYEESSIEPVYIVLSYTDTTFGKVIKTYQRSTYTHAGLSLEPTLGKIYSFNLQPKLNINGLSIESLDAYNDKNNNAKLKILVVFISNKAKKKLLEVLHWFEEHVESTRYSFKNIFNIVINKSEDMLYNTSMVCSQFVDSVLKMCNINITDKSSNLVTPKTFEKIDKKKTKNALVYSIYEGWKTEYNWKEIKRKVKALMNKNKKVVLSENIISTLFEYKIENLKLFVEDNKELNRLFKEFNEYLTPVAIISEINFPIKFTNKGDLVITKKEDLQLEYNESHKLLSMYDQTNEEGIKHELAKLFYLNSIIEKKVKKMKNSDSTEYKELIDLRARILNDFSTYFKLIKSIDPQFDFTEYIKNSEYYNKTIIVDNSTLKYSGKLIKDFIKNII